MNNYKQTVANYAYLGLSAAVNINYPQPGVTMALNDGLGNSPGLDLFGRVIDVPWTTAFGSSSSSSSSGAMAALVNLGYGYDQASNRKYRQDFVAETFGQPFDEKYENDGLYRLKKFQRGTLVGGVITSPGLQQAWNLDATGNWKDFAQFDPANNATNTFDQQRTSNAANEIIDLMPTVGGTWAKPGYDRNGNMTTMPQPNNPTSGYTATPDAWNRLVRLVDPSSGNLVQKNQYDGRNFRIVRLSYSSGSLSETRDFYYSSDWKVLDEYVDGAFFAELEYVWGLRYIDDLILRDNFTAGLRLYAMQDANWNVVAICDDSGSVQERYAYTAYGVCTVLNPDFSVKTGGTAYDWTVLYTGRALDWATGLYYYRNRYYLALLGVFVSRDPVGYRSGVNLYGYVSSRSLNFVDPFGLLLIDNNIYQAHHWFPTQFRVRIEAKCKEFNFNIDVFTTFLYAGRWVEKNGVSRPSMIPSEHYYVHNGRGAIGRDNWNPFVRKALDNSEDCCSFLLQVAAERELVLKELEDYRKKNGIEDRSLIGSGEMQFYPGATRPPELIKFTARALERVNTLKLLQAIEEECRCRKKKKKPNSIDVYDWIIRQIEFGNQTENWEGQGATPTGDETKVIVAGSLVLRAAVAAGEAASAARAASAAGEAGPTTLPFPEAAGGGGQTLPATGTGP